MGVGFGFSSGANSRNFCICKRDKASAIGLFEPGICWNWTRKLCVAEIRKIFRAKSIRSLDLDDCADQIATLVELSVLNMSFLLGQL